MLASLKDFPSFATRTNGDLTRLQPRTGYDTDMPWLFANASRRVFRCADGTIALVWWDAFGVGETFECLEHGVRTCAHVREMNAALQPGPGVPSRPDPRMFDRQAAIPREAPNPARPR
jgi:hypothetical protein